MRLIVCMLACVLGVVELEKDTDVVKTVFATSRELEEWKTQMVVRHEHADAQLLLGMARSLAIAVNVFT